MKNLLFGCCLFGSSLLHAQGIIATTPGSLQTVTATGAFSSTSPKLGVNVVPTANLDVEGIPQNNLLSNIRFRNLPPTTDTMILVRNNDGFVTWRGISTLPKTGGPGAAWLLTGNTVSGTDFIGTLNNDDMRFQTSSTQRMRLLREGSLSVEVTGASNTANDNGNILVGISNTIERGQANTLSGWENRAQNTYATIMAGQGNQAAPIGGGIMGKSVALGWANRLQSSNQYLIGAANSAEQEYSGTFGVGLTVTQGGSWYLGGTTGTSLTNSLSNSLAIGWGSLHTGLFDVNGLTLGTATSNTTGAIDAATARIDVNGLPFNGFPSGVRFRDLPNGSGYVLVIAPDGYVYKSRTMLRPAANEALESEVKTLKDHIALLQQQVQAILNGNKPAGDIAAVGGDNTLRIVPTPFHDKATVMYAIENYTNNAVLRVADSKGVLLQTIPLRQAKGQVEVYQPVAAAGVLVFSLLVDGKLVVSKQSVAM